MPSRLMKPASRSVIVSHRRARRATHLLTSDMLPRHTESRLCDGRCYPFPLSEPHPFEPWRKVKVNNLPFQQTIKRIVVPCLLAVGATIVFALQSKSIALTHDFLNLY